MVVIALAVIVAVPISIVFFIIMLMMAILLLLLLIIIIVICHSRPPSSKPFLSFGIIAATLFSKLFKSFPRLVFRCIIVTTLLFTFTIASIANTNFLA